MNGGLIDDLRVEVASGRAMLVVGSGISIGATNNAQAARWAGLIQLGIDRCLALQQIDATRAIQLSTRLSERAPIEDLISVAETVTQALLRARQGEYGLWLKETVGSLTAIDTTVLHELDRLNVDIATTNYDNILEENTKVKKHVAWPNIGGVLRVLRRQESAILHLHGHWADPASVVLGIRSYEDLLRNNAAQAVAKSLPMLRTLVFIGCGDGLQDPNFKRLIDWYQDVLQLAEHRHYRLVTDRDLEKGRVSEGVYDLAFGDHHRHLPSFLAGLRAPRPIVLGNESKVHLTLHLDHWADSLLRSPVTSRIAEGNIDAARSDPVFRAIIAATDQHEKRFSIEAVSVRHGFTTTPANFEDFLLDILSVLVLDKRNSGYLKGVIKSVSGILGRANSAPSFLEQVLDKILRRHIAEDSELLDPSIAQLLLQAAIETFGSRDADGLFRFVKHIAFFDPQVDMNCLRTIQNTLVAHADSLTTNIAVSRAYMNAVRTLIGQISWEVRGRLGSAPLEIPIALPVKNSPLLGYPIDTLQTPITNMQWHEVTGRHFAESARKPSHPFVFDMIGPTGVELFESLASELEVLVASFRQVEGNAEFDWDVPTVAEWLALAGCETSPYPWGVEPPTPDHANLRYGTQKTTLQAVGLYSKGNSPHGAADCCGNAHEIVRVDFSDTFPRGFRLAGGCFQNPPAPCNVFRPFRRQKGEEEIRRNVSVRLIRYSKKDAEKRSLALEEYLGKK